MAILTRTAGQTLSLSEVRAFFDGKFDPAVAGVDGSSLSHYLRDGGIVPVTAQGGGGVTYPATGGIALDDLGSVTHSGTTSWPNVAVDLMGMTTADNWNNDLAYNAGATTAFGSITNNTGQNLSIRNVTVSVTFDDLGGNANLSYFIWVRRGTTTLFTVPSRTVTAAGEVIQNQSGTRDWANGVSLNFGIFSNSSGFTYTANYVRINLSAEEEFAPTGTGGGGAINEDVPETSPLMLSQLRNVDDGLPPANAGAREERSLPQLSFDTTWTPTEGPNGET